MKPVLRLCCLLSVLALSACVVEPYAPYGYAYPGPVVYGPAGPYYYVTPPVWVYGGYGRRR